MGRGADLLRTWYDAIITVVFGGAAIYVAYRMSCDTSSVTGRWEIVRVNLKLLMVGRFPDDELWRVCRRRCGPGPVGRDCIAGAGAGPQPPCRNLTSHAGSSLLRSGPTNSWAGPGRRSSTVGVLLALYDCRRTVDRRQRSPSSPAVLGRLAGVAIGSDACRRGRPAARASGRAGVGRSAGRADRGADQRASAGTSGAGS